MQNWTESWRISCRTDFLLIWEPVSHQHLLSSCSSPDPSRLELYQLFFIIQNYQYSFVFGPFSSSSFLTIYNHVPSSIFHTRLREQILVIDLPIIFTSTHFTLLRGYSFIRLLFRDAARSSLIASNSPRLLTSFYHSQQFVLSTRHAHRTVVQFPIPCVLLPLCKP